MGIEYILTADGELYHHGTKGMKWGRRLYQNKDGSLTPLGKKRYAREESALKEREKTIKNREREAAKRARMDAKKADLDAREAALNSDKKSSTAKDTGKAKTKSIKDMSDEELNDAIQRARLEDTYRNLRPEPVAKPSFGKQLLNDAVKPALISSGKKALESVVDKTVKDLLKDKVDPNSLAGIEAANKKLAAQLENKLLKMGINPNIKSENLSKWKDFNAGLKEVEEAEKQAKKDAKAKKAQEKADAKAAKEAERERKEEMKKYREYNKNWYDRDNSKPSSDSTYNNSGGERVDTRPWREQANSSPLLLEAPRKSENARIAEKMVAGYLDDPITMSDRAAERGKRYVDNNDFIAVVDQDGTLTFIPKDELR